LFSVRAVDTVWGDPPASKERPFGLTQRTPWTTSRITGSPDPPLPYRIERVFPKLVFKNPLLITSAPGTERLFVGEHAGKLYSFPKDPACVQADMFLDLTKLQSWDPKGKVKGVGAVYGLAFHPRFAENRLCYVCYVLDSKTDGEQLPDGTRLSRFKVSATNPPRCDPHSEQVMMTWLAGGHNGGCLQFGPDSCLYISTGDGADPNPPDVRDTGQDISDLLSSILRIDVDRAPPGKPYAVPTDNPFVKTPGARPEVWAYGFRNPWRMSFDRLTGELWVGDVGWELWEMVYRVERGGNYGWSVMEGRQQVRPESKRGPTPILPPTLDFPHTEAASITGGYVYRGKRLKELVGAYICGDWVTRKLWGTRFNGNRITWHRELARGTQRIVAFGEDHDGELYFLNYDEVGTIHQIVPSETREDTSAAFPRQLSQTGLFKSVPAHEPAPGVLPFAVNAEQWADYATVERFVALPGQSTVTLYDRPVDTPTAFVSGRVFFPKDGVLAKTLSLEMERGNPRSRRRLETQILHFDGVNWRGYSYQWNDTQTDATLIGAEGLDISLNVVDAQAPGGKRRQTWHFPGRAECLRCHNPWAGYGLAFTQAQLDRDVAYGAITDNQMRSLQHIGVLTPTTKPGTEHEETPASPKPLTNPQDTRAALNDRARAYLHVNCSHCHQMGAGGTADIELRSEFSLGETKTVEVRPVQGTFEIAGAQILAPGDPYRSVLYLRISKLGPGRMPHVGSEIVDEAGLRLIHDWIRQLPQRRDERVLIERLRALDESAVLAGERERRAQELQRLALLAARAAGRTMASEADRREAETQLCQRAAAGVQARAAERTQVINRLLGSTSSALLLARALAEGQVADSARAQILALAMARPEAQVRDLFERFVPDEQRVKRLGSVIKPDQILALTGNGARGKDLFFRPGSMQCINCHRIAGTGSTLGPDLTQIGKKYTRAQILESILEPSKKIDPEYVTYLVETTDGRIQTGLLTGKNAREVILKVVGDKEVRIPANQVATVVPQRNSLMPELLLRDLTAAQVADLLEYLSSLK
jgi:putative heme-binding domain-containing protein